MATWPYSPLTTYVADNPPAIKAGDLNAIQAAINELYLKRVELESGDGADGDVVLDGINVYPTLMTLVGTTYTLITSVNLHDVLLNGCRLSRAGFELFINGTLTVQGIGSWIESDGSPGNNFGGAGAGCPTGAVYGGADGGAGGIGTNNGSNGGSVGYSLGEGGGTGGAGGIQTPGFSGVAVPLSNSTGANVRHLSTRMQGYVPADVAGTPTLLGIRGGAGGSGGGAAGSAAGGGGGGGGVGIAAIRRIVLQANLLISADGGAGGDGDPLGGLPNGGGGGGGGGVNFFTHGPIDLNGNVLTVRAQRGPGGVGVNGGISGTSGVDGRVIEHDLTLL